MADETEQERKDRLAQKEADRILAEQQAQDALATEQAALPQTAIPANNVSFTNGPAGSIQIDLPEGYAPPPTNQEMIGDAQYQWEVARARRTDADQRMELAAQRGPAFVEREAAQRAKEDKLAAQAKRFTAIQGYQEAIKNGNTPAEAMALYGKDMYAGVPGDLAKLVTSQKLTPKLPASVQSTPIMDAAGNVTGQTVMDPVTGRIHSSLFNKPPTMPVGDVAAQKILQGKIDQAQKDLQRAKKDAERGDNSEADRLAATRRALAAQNHLSELEQQFQVGSTNWQGQIARPTINAAPRPSVGATPAPAAPESTPFKEGATIRDKQNGKLYRVVNGKPVELKQ